MGSGVRIDKWLWAVRLFKTRSIASEACKKGVVTIGGNSIKPSRAITVGEVVTIRREPIRYSYKVLDLLERRVGAKLVPDYLVDVTPQSELDTLEMVRYSHNGMRDRGTGRPTKRDRRDIESFTDADDDIDEWLD